MTFVQNLSRAATRCCRLQVKMCIRLTAEIASRLSTIRWILQNIWHEKSNINMPTIVIKLINFSLRPQQRCLFANEICMHAIHLKSNEYKFNSSFNFHRVHNLSPLLSEKSFTWLSTVHRKFLPILHKSQSRAHEPVWIREKFTVFTGAKFSQCANAIVSPVTMITYKRVGMVDICKKGCIRLMKLCRLNFKIYNTLPMFVFAWWPMWKMKIPWHQLFSSWLVNHLKY